MANRTDAVKALDIGAAALLIIGGLCWGLTGIAGWNPIDSVFGSMSGVSRIIYGLIGAAALYEVILWRAIQRRWECTPWPRFREETAG